MSTSPRTPLTPKHLAIRQEILAANGINYNFPLGRSYPYFYPANMEVYDGSALSVFGYIVDQYAQYRAAYDHGIDRSTVTAYEDDYFQWKQPMVFQ
ncbi:hypothetical protein MTO96_028661, partial [Rhipicephalus appendiculatus]